MAEQKLQYKLDFGLALGIIAFCWVTVKARYQIEDGPLITIYGYPYIWHWWDPSLFKVRVINPLALFANFMLYVGTIGVLGSFLAFWGRYVSFMIVLRLALWIGAIASMIHLAGFFYETGFTIAFGLPVGKLFNEVWYLGRSYPF